MPAYCPLGESLPSIFSGKDRWYSCQEDCQIQTQRPFPDHEEIEPASLSISKPAAPLDLPQSTKSRLYAQELTSRGAIVSFYFPCCKRPWPNKCHLASHNVPQLRQLVNRVLSARYGEPAGNARVIGVLDISYLGGFRCEPFHKCQKPALTGTSIPHGSEFQYPNWSSGLSHAAVSNQRRPTREQDSDEPDESQ
jgi:hypothetical protein